MQTATVTFERGRDGAIAYIEGKVSFVHKSEKQPDVGTTWEVEVRPRERFNFLRLIRPVEVLLPRLIIVGRPSYYRDDVQIDGANIPDMEVISGQLIKFSLPSAARARSSANQTLRLTPGETYVLLYASYNGRNGACVVRKDGLTSVFDYGDGHGMRWAALLKVEAYSWSVDWDVTAHHDHGRTKHRATGDLWSFTRKDAEREVEEAKTV